MEADGPIPAGLRKRTSLNYFKLLVKTQKVVNRAIILSLHCSSAKSFQMNVPETAGRRNLSVSRLMENEGKFGFAPFPMEMNQNLLCLSLCFYLLLQVNTSWLKCSISLENVEIQHKQEEPFFTID